MSCLYPKLLVLLLLLVFCGSFCLGGSAQKASLEAEARSYLQYRDAIGGQLLHVDSKANWNYDANLTEENRQVLSKVQEEIGAADMMIWQDYLEKEWDTKWKTLKDPDLKRQFYLLSKQGESALPPNKLAEYHAIESDMVSTYSKAKIHLCPTKDSKDCDLSLEPDISNLLIKSRDYDVLEDAWTMWRDVSGKLVRDKFKRYVELNNEIATLNDFADAGEMWRDVYETKDFPAYVANLWEDLKPLYQQLHAYVRRKLREEYGADKISEKGPIPAHLLGNMWAQSWEDIEDIVKPYPDKPSLDVGNVMKEQGYTPLKMFQLANTFFKELNLKEMSQSFWKKSVFEKPPYTEMVCHASAWDLSKDRDFRIKMCTEVSMKYLVTIHHEMGHIEYFEQYRHQPTVYRTGANPGFHEAVGDTLALSVNTPKHLNKIGLLSESKQDYESTINYQMHMALSKVVFLPFGYLIDMYRWDVFSGKTSPDDLNCKWWNLRYELQGLKPPVKRSETDFDPGAKYHVVASVPYIRYFVSYIVQFQFHKALCEKAGQYEKDNPDKTLQNCDINQSKAAGDALSSMLKMGASKHWRDALEKLTGSRDLDVSVLREYFKPLEDWLIEDNAKHGEHIGWEKDGDYCE